MLRCFPAILALGLVLSVAPAVGADSSAHGAAVAAAEQWLQLVDAGNYAESWKQAAPVFRDAVPQAQWEQSASAARKPLGRLLSRRLKSATPRTELPGVPDGSYVVIEFESSLENKKSAVETVTPVLDRDGAWRVSGYYIR